MDVDEDTTVDADGMLDWLCWAWAMDGERFYPPDETASECTDALMEERDSDDRQSIYEQEFAEHCRAYTEAVEKFNDLQCRGFDPIARAERHIEEARANGLEGLPDIDWEWAEESGRVETE